MKLGGRGGRAAWGGWKEEDGFGEREQMCLGTSFWSRFGELGGSGGDMVMLGAGLLTILCVLSVDCWRERQAGQ